MEGHGAGHLQMTLMVVEDMIQAILQGRLTTITVVMAVSLGMVLAFIVASITATVAISLAILLASKPAFITAAATIKPVTIQAFMPATTINLVMVSAFMPGSIALLEAAIRAEQTMLAFVIEVGVLQAIATMKILGPRLLVSPTGKC